MLAFSIDYYGVLFRATQSVGLFCTYTVSALRAIVEYIAIKHSVIPKVVEIPLMAWGVPGECPRYESNTNLTDENLDLFTEEVNILVNHNILSSAALG